MKIIWNERFVIDNSLDSIITYSLIKAVYPTVDLVWVFNHNKGISFDTKFKEKYVPLGKKESLKDCNLTFLWVDVVYSWIKSIWYFYQLPLDNLNCENPNLKSWNLTYDKKYPFNIFSYVYENDKGIRDYISKLPIDIKELLVSVSLANKGNGDSLINYWENAKEWLSKMPNLAKLINTTFKGTKNVDSFDTFINYVLDWVGKKNAIVYDYFKRLNTRNSIKLFSEIIKTNNILSNIWNTITKCESILKNQSQFTMQVWEIKEYKDKTILYSKIQELHKKGLLFSYNMVTSFRIDYLLII